MNQDFGRRGNILVVRPREGLAVFKSLASDIRLDIMELLVSGPLNVNEISHKLALPQSTVATHVLKLQEAGLIETDNKAGSRGIQKICHAVYDEIVIDFPSLNHEPDNVIDVQMPVGLFTRYDVSPPCGLCSAEKVIGYFDVPSQFLHPERITAGLVWFGRGFVEYQFPNNLLNTNRDPESLEIIAEISADVPGTDNKWRTDVELSVNGIDIGAYSCQGDFGENRGIYTPRWRPLNTSQYGLLKHWTINGKGSRIDGMPLSDVKLADLSLQEHKSIRVKFEVSEAGEHPGGLNIFGRGFGNYNQDILLRLTLRNGR